MRKHSHEANDMKRNHAQQDFILLYWYFNEYGGSFLRSSTGPTLDRMKYGLPPAPQSSGDSCMSDGIIRTIDKARMVERILAEMKASDIRVLKAYVTTPPHKLAAFGEYAGVARYTESAREFAGTGKLLVELSARALSGVSDDRARATAINLDSERLVDKAMQRFRKAREVLGE